MTAAVVTQVKNFNDTQSGSGSGTFVHAGPGGLYDTFNPFNSSLGTLNSFTIAWVIDLTSDGTTDAGGGSILIQIAKAGLVRRTFQTFPSRRVAFTGTFKDRFCFSPSYESPTQPIPHWPSCSYSECFCLGESDPLGNRGGPTGTPRCSMVALAAPI
jgi:hypothetical protein